MSVKLLELDNDLYKVMAMTNVVSGCVAFILKALFILISKLYAVYVYHAISMQCCYDDC